MRLSGSAWSFVGASLTESVGLYRAMGISGMELLASPGGLLNSKKIIEDPVQEALRIRDLGVPVPNIIFLFGHDFHERALNHKDPGVRQRNAEDFSAVAEFCHQSGIPSVTVLPGIQQDGWSLEKSVAVSAEALNVLTAVAQGHGIQLLFEAHVGSILQRLEDSLQFLDRNPHLRLTLDYGHFTFGGYGQEEIDCLVPFARHVHLRQAATKVLQARWEDGVVDFKKVINKLRTVNYSGYLTIEYEHDSWMDCDRVDVISEIIKMRNLVLSQL